MNLFSSSEGIIVLSGIIYDRIYFGYTYDFTLTDMKNQSIGTMELTLAARFEKVPGSTEGLIHIDIPLNNLTLLHISNYSENLSLGQFLVKGMMTFVKIIT